MKAGSVLRGWGLTSSKLLCVLGFFFVEKTYGLMLVVGLVLLWVNAHA